MFKKCTMCQKNWETMDAFSSDKDLIFNGYQVNILRPLKGMFIFTHAIPMCGTSVAIRIEKFQELSESPLPFESIIRPEDCPGHCLDEKSVEVCTAESCPGKLVREVLYKLHNYKKESV